MSASNNTTETVTVTENVNVDANNRMRMSNDSTSDDEIDDVHPERGFIVPSREVWCIDNGRSCDCDGALRGSKADVR